MFKSLFGSKNKTPESKNKIPETDLYKDQPFSTFESIPFSEMLKIMGQSTGTSRGTTISLIQRFIQIALWDDTINDEERKKSFALVAELRKFHDENWGSNHLLDQAINEDFQSGRESGIGSLVHKLKNLPPDKRTLEIVKLENSHLLANFPCKVWERSRPEIIRTLIYTRGFFRAALTPTLSNHIYYEPVIPTNAVIASARLLLVRDPTAMWLFTNDERNKLVRYLDDYESARDVLVRSDVITNTSHLPLFPIPNPEQVYEFLISSCFDEDTGKWNKNRGDERETLLNCDRQLRELFVGIILQLRIFIWFKTLKSIYGQEYLDTVIESGKEKGQTLKSSKDAVSRIEFLYDVAIDFSKEYSFDVAVLSHWLAEGLDRTLPESHNNKIVSACSAVFSNELLCFPAQMRYLLLLLVNGNDKGDEAREEDALYAILDTAPATY